MLTIVDNMGTNGELLRTCMSVSYLYISVSAYRPSKPSATSEVEEGKGIGGKVMGARRPDSHRHQSLCSKKVTL